MYDITLTTSSVAGTTRGFSISAYGIVTMRDITITGTSGVVTATGPRTSPVVPVFTMTNVAVSGMVMSSNSIAVTGTATTDMVFTDIVSTSLPSTGTHIMVTTYSTLLVRNVSTTEGYYAVNTASPGTASSAIVTDNLAVDLSSPTTTTTAIYTYAYQILAGSSSGTVYAANNTAKFKAFGTTLNLPRMFSVSGTTNTTIEYNRVEGSIGLLKYTNTAINNHRVTVQYNTLKDVDMSPGYSAIEITGAASYYGRYYIHDMEMNAMHDGAVTTYNYMYFASYIDLLVERINVTNGNKIIQCTGADVNANATVRDLIIKNVFAAANVPLIDIDAGLTAGYANIYNIDIANTDVNARAFEISTGRFVSVHDIVITGTGGLLSYTGSSAVNVILEIYNVTITGMTPGSTAVVNIAGNSGSATAQYYLHDLSFTVPVASTGTHFAITYYQNLTLENINVTQGYVILTASGITTSSCATVRNVRGTALNGAAVDRNYFTIETGITTGVLKFTNNYLEVAAATTWTRMLGVTKANYTLIDNNVMVRGGGLLNYDVSAAGSSTSQYVLITNNVLTDILTVSNAHIIKLNGFGTNNSASSP